MHRTSRQYCASNFHNNNSIIIHDIYEINSIVLLATKYSIFIIVYCMSKHLLMLTFILAFNNRRNYRLLTRKYICIDTLNELIFIFYYRTHCGLTPTYSNKMY